MADDNTTPISASEQKKEDWMNSKWRPMMGWMYMLVCTMDFVVFPILWSLLQSISHGQVTSQWQPLTLQGAGLFHIAMGGVLGLAAYGRTQEKLNGANNGGLQQPGLGTTYIPPTGNTSVTVSNQPPASGGFGGSSNGFGTSSGGASTFGAPATGGFGSPAPAAGGFGSSASTGAGAVGSSTGGFGSTPADTSQSATQVVAGFGGKPAPVQPSQPAI